MKSSWLAYMLGGMTVLGIWTLASHKELLKDMKDTMCDTATKAVQKFKDMGNEKSCECNCQTTTE